MTATSSARAQRWVRGDDVLWRQAFDAIVLLPSGVSEPIVLTGTGKQLWQELATPSTVADIACRLADTFGVEANAVASDIAPVIERLAGMHAVRPYQ